jgi:plasmid stability protein
MLVGFPLVPFWNQKEPLSMATLTIKNIPTDLYERLKQCAARDRRSINNQVIVCLEQALTSLRPDADAILKEARTVRRKTSRYVVTDKVLTRVKQEGRP